MSAKKYLILENGLVMEGQSLGFAGETVGEVVFATGMTGYVETLTDPSYYGQIVTQTFPLIGNYGVIPADFESDRPHLKGYIVREWCQEPSNYRCEGDLDTFLKENRVVGIAGIDTRALTRVVREHGVMNGKIADSPEVTPALLEELRTYRIQGAVAAVTGEKRSEGLENSRCRVALYDFGAKRHIARKLVKRGCLVETVPAFTKAEEILKSGYDGVMLSNGPGDPAENASIIREMKILMESGIPMFGICLGHQLMALAAGAKTEKLKYGHRGGNQPVTDLSTGRVYITSQNHGYAVANDSLPDGAVLRFINANDGTCEGIEYPKLNAFTVQFHPEACGGPRDTGFLFDRFIAQMLEKKEVK